MSRSIAVLTALALVLPVAAGDAEKNKEQVVEPDHIVVQHILIAFEGTLPGKKILRNQHEARALAYKLLKRAQDGEDFDALVKEYTDDSHPGIYGMSNKGIAPAKGEYARTQMVGAFGDVGFVLAVDEVGIADFDPRTSKYGYHVIKRLE